MLYSMTAYNAQSQACNFLSSHRITNFHSDVYESSIKSRVTWATSVPISVILGLYSGVRPDVRDRQTSDKIIG